MPNPEKKMNQAPRTPETHANSITAENLVALRPELARYARSLTRNPDKADDLVQDLFVRALQNKDKFQEGTNLKGWLFTVMRNHFLSGIRRGKLIMLAGDPEEAMRNTPVNQTQDVELDEKQLEVFMTELSLSIARCWSS